ncbi:hypothetical protein ACFQPF_12335 [Fictibacillus iocasae]|uniref:Uncharacterized protein n=1 Tax=Fictibacillus iocasae TaxID=2715437 RepID=A0ABW2NTW0_9BACL
MKRYVLSIVCVLFVVAVLAAGTNPTEQDYHAYTEKETGKITPESVIVERIDFQVFSTFAPHMPNDEYSIVHLGFMGMFFQISKKMNNYPEWLEMFRECACAE